MKRKCRCKDGSYSVKCCFHTSQRSRGFNSGPGYTPDYTTYGATPHRVAQQVGKTLINYGTIKQGSALIADHPIQGKIWTQYSKKELRAQKRRTGNTPLDQPVRKYDTRPERHTGRQKAHWERRPMTGQYSRAKSGNVKLYRARKFTEATAIKGGGYAIRGLGYAYYGYFIYSVYQDPSPKNIIKLATSGIPAPEMGVMEDWHTGQPGDPTPLDQAWENLKKIFN